MTNDNTNEHEGTGFPELDPVEKACIEAEADKFVAEAAAKRAEARLQTAMAEVAEIEMRRQQLSEKVELAQNFHHKVYVFDKEVTEASVKACIQQLQTWARNDPGCDMEIQLNSPGGSIFDGFALVDFIRDLRAKGHHVTTVGIGMVASMAGVILQSGDKRVMGANALLLIHEGSLGAIGDFGKVEDRIALMSLMHDKILDLFAERSTMSKAAIKKAWTRKDWWLPAETSLKNGFCDEVR